MTRPARVVTWNGKDIPSELRELTPEEEAGIDAALGR